jgi:hypothetical protein
MINTQIQPVTCVSCGVLALAQIEGIPFCAGCLLSKLDSLERWELQERLEPLNVAYPSIEAALMGAVVR